MVDNTNTH